MLVEVRQALFGYGNRPVVQVDQLTLHAGRCLGVFGPNGTGKTTLIRGLTGLLTPLRGEVRRGTREPSIGYLPQHRAMELQWPMTGFDAAALATSARWRLGWIGRAARRETSVIRASMRRFGVDDLASCAFAKLSGGQQQRLLLAGALAADPAVLVLDEPTDGLDLHSRRTLLDQLHDCTARGLSTVVISHEVEDLLELCHEIAWLHAASASGEPSQVECIEPNELARRILKLRRAR